MPRNPARRPDGNDATGTADGRVCVVATRKATFERCRQGIYPAPKSYDRTATPFEYMAFYRTAPVSAVTHYARVTARVEQERGSGGPMTARDWTDLVEPVSDTSTVVVFELGELAALETPVENDRHGVRGAWYCTLSALGDATTLSELAAAAGE